MRKWTQEEITKWAVDTFGRPRDVIKLIRRAEDEFQEVENAYWNDHPEEIIKEVADVVIVLSQVVEQLGGNLDEAIDEKMEINSKRNWIITEDGIGRHQ